MFATASRRRLLLLAGTALAVLAAALFGGVLARGDGPTPGAEPAGSAAARAKLGELGISTGAPSSLTALEAEAKRDPSGAVFTQLGLAHLDSVTTTGDASGYARADAALNRAVELEPRSYDALVALATLAAARHDFPTALDFATRAEVLQPMTTDALGILGDSQLELGDYDAAFATFDRMAATKPTLASYSRVAYGRELTGDRRGAVAAMTLAADVGAGSEAAAFPLLQRGNLYLALDDMDAAERDYRAALRVVPEQAGALGGLARIAFAEGRVDESIALYERAIEASPLPEHPMELSKVLRGAGRAEEARAADRLVDEFADIERANGALLDFEVAVHDLDEGSDPEVALRTIRETWKVRKSIDTQDALAWALVKTGRCAEARRHSIGALRLGTQSGTKMFHRAEAERCLGNTSAARTWYRRALAAEPHFSAQWVARARAGARS